MRKFMTGVIFAVSMGMLVGCGSAKTENNTNATATATTEELNAVSVKAVPIELNAEEYVKLGEYKGIEISNGKQEVTDEDVENEINALLDEYVSYEEVTDHDTVQEGDTINIDYIAVINGETNDDYSDQEADMEVGAGAYVLGDTFDMESGVIGTKVGDKVTLDLTFPEDYEEDETVAGQPCTMEITVNRIEQLVTPELTDEFIKENTESNTVEEYRALVREQLEEEATDDIENNKQIEVWEKTMNNAELIKDFPEDILEQQKQNIYAQNAEWLSYMDMDVEDFISQYYEMSLDDYAVYSLKEQCVQDLLMEAEDISVTEDDYKEEISAMIEEEGYEDEDEILQYYTKNEIMQNLAYSLLTEKLLSYAVVAK